MTVEADAIDIGRVSVDGDRVKFEPKNREVNHGSLDIDLNDLADFYFVRSARTQGKRGQGALVLKRKDGGQEVLPLSTEDGGRVLTELRKSRKPAEQEVPPENPPAAADREVSDGEDVNAADRRKTR